MDAGEVRKRRMGQKVIGRKLLGGTVFRSVLNLCWLCPSFFSHRNPVSPPLFFTLRTAAAVVKRECFTSKEISQIGREEEGKEDGVSKPNLYQK